MARFIALPPEVEAEQWDGTIEGVQAVAPILKRFSRGFLEVKTLVDNGRTTSHIHVPRDGGYLKAEYRDVVVYPNDWVIVTHEGRLQVMNDEDFKKRYVEAPL